MDRNRLVIFCEAAKSQSVKQTADKLGLTSSTVSRTIGLIEEEIGYKVFASSPRMHLTQAGETFLTYATLSLIQYEGLLKKLQDNSPEIEGDYILTTGTVLDSVTIFDALRDFIEYHPGLSISFMETDKLPDFSLRETHIDIRPLRHDKEEIEAHYLKTNVINLYASEECLLKYGNVSNLKDFQKHNLLVFPNDRNKEADQNLNWYLPKINVSVKKTVIQSRIVMKEAIETGLGIGSLSEAEAQASKVTLIPILPNILSHKIDTYFMYPKTFSQTKAITAIYEQLKRYFEERAK